MLLTRRLLLCLGTALATPGPARAREVPVADRAALDRLLPRASPGDVLALAPGEYGALSVAGPAGAPGAPVVIAAADPARPPRLARLALRDPAHLVLRDLRLCYRFAAADPIDTRPFAVTGGTNVRVTGCRIEGDMARGVSAIDDGHGWGTGLFVSDCSGLRIDGCDFDRFHRGLVVQRCADVAVTGCDLHGLRMDGMTFVQVARVRIEGNRIRDFDRAPDSADHADMIQFWTTRSTAPSTDITIRANLLSSGRGLFTQSIFMRNEEVDTGRAGAAMVYRRVRIEDNVILNAHLHGITVGETAGLVIRNNSVCRNPLSQGAADNPDLWTPRINVAAAATGVEITRNVTGGVPQAQPGWTVADNLVVQDRTRMRPNFYGKLFGGDPAEPGGFRYLAGGPLDGAGLGSPLMQAGRG